MTIILKTIGIIARDIPMTLQFYRLVGLSIPPEAESEANVDFETESGVVPSFSVFS